MVFAGHWDPWTGHISDPRVCTHIQRAASELKHSLSGIACSCVILYGNMETVFCCFAWLETVFTCTLFGVGNIPFYRWEWYFLFSNDTRKTFQLSKLRCPLSVVLKHKLNGYCMENIKGLWIIYWNKYVINGNLRHLKKSNPKFDNSYYRWFTCYIVLALLVEKLGTASCWQIQIYGKFLSRQWFCVVQRWCNQEGVLALLKSIGKTLLVLVNSFFARGLFPNARLPC